MLRCRFGVLYGFYGCNVQSFCVVFVSMCLCVLKSLTGLFPRSMLMIGHVPPQWVSRRSCRSFNVLLCLEILSFALYLHPPTRCVLVRGWLHFRGGFKLHLFVGILSSNPLKRRNFNPLKAASQQKSGQNDNPRAMTMKPLL